MSIHTPDSPRTAAQPELIGPRLESGDFLSNVPHSGEPVSNELGGLTEGRVDRLVADTPADPSEIDPLTGAVDYKPHSEKAEPKSGKSTWIKVGAATAGLAAVAGAFTLGRSSGSSAPNDTKRVVATAGPVPGSAAPAPRTPSQAPMPSASEIAPVPSPKTETLAPGAETQNKLFERITLAPGVLPDMASYEASKVAPDALNQLKGTEGRVPLFENFNQTLLRQEAAFAQVTPEDVAALQDRRSMLLSAKYNIVQDGNLKQVGATEFYDNAKDHNIKLWFSATNKESMLFNFNRPFTDKADEAVTAVARLMPMDNKVLRQFLTRSQDLSAYNNAHPNDQLVNISEPLISPYDVINRTIVRPQSIPKDYYDNRIARAFDESDPLAANGRVYLVKYRQNEFRSADGTTTAKITGATITYKEEFSGKYRMDTVVIYPVDSRLKNNGLTNEAVIQTGVKGYFETAIVSSQYAGE